MRLRDFKDGECYLHFEKDSEGDVAVFLCRKFTRFFIFPTFKYLASDYLRANATYQDGVDAVFARYQAILLMIESGTEIRQGRHRLEESDAERLERIEMAHFRRMAAGSFVIMSNQDKELQ